jgi:DNA-binding response OmpR family regulator
MRVLIIEDEAKVASFISKGLEEEAYEVEVVYNGRDGLDRLTADRYDIVLLDLMIPEISGLEVLKTIRERGVNTPVLIITAKSSKEDVVRGLDTGSDDYLTKPFSFDELLARIRALLRRDAARNTPVIRYKGLMLNPFDRTLAVGAQVVELTEKEFMILELLVRTNERSLSRREIADYVWQNATDSTNIVDVYINFLRKKIESITPRKYIHTIRGVGYVLKEEHDKTD